VYSHIEVRADDLVDITEVPDFNKVSPLDLLVWNFG